MLIYICDRPHCPVRRSARASKPCTWDEGQSEAWTRDAVRSATLNHSAMSRIVGEEYGISPRIPMLRSCMFASSLQVCLVGSFLIGANAGAWLPIGRDPLLLAKVPCGLRVTLRPEGDGVDGCCGCCGFSGLVSPRLLEIRVLWAIRATLRRG